MNCDDYLSMLATVPLEEMSYDGAREHIAECRDCNRVTRVVVEREQNMLMAYDNLYSSVPATQTAARALESSHRMSAGRRYTFGLSAAAIAAFVCVAGALGLLMVIRLFPKPLASTAAPALVTDRFVLRCLSGVQAEEIVRLIVRDEGSIIVPPTSPGNVIFVEAPREAMDRVRIALISSDNLNLTQGTCTAAVAVPKTPRVP